MGVTRGWLPQREDSLSGECENEVGKEDAC